MEEERRKKLTELLGEEWMKKIGNEFDHDYMIALSTKIAQERETKTIFPKTEDIFNAFKYTPFSKVKVVLIGQDPYHSVGSDGKTGIAHGLAFSSQDSATCPPSLENIFNELEKDIMFGLYLDQNPNLKYWADQGVFLLNKVLTVEKGKANSHKNLGWEVFTMKVIKQLVKSPNRLVFILWGNEAKEYKKIIPNDGYHLVLEAAHPAAESYRPDAGFYGSKPFSKTNNFLESNGYTPINW